MANDASEQESRPIGLRQMRALIAHADELLALIAESKKIAPALSVEDVINALTKVSELNFSELLAIFNAIDNLNLLKNEYGSSDKAIDGVALAFWKDRLPGLDEKREKIRAAIDEYSGDNPIAISLKAKRLSYLYERVVADSEIITDARPIFDTKRESVLEYVISHCLVITYHDENSVSGQMLNQPSIHFALDMDDLLKLRKEIERAILKARTLEKDLGNKAKVLGGHG